MPSTAALVKDAIGNKRAAAMDLAAACSGFVYGYATAHAYIASGMARHVLVIGAETLSRCTDWTDRGTCILFGDAAGAVVLSASDEPGGTLGIEMTTEPSGAYFIWLPAGGAARPATGATLRSSRALHEDEGQRDLQDGRPDARLDLGAGHREGRARPGRHRPRHPASGQHPDHRGSRQVARLPDGASLRQRRPLRQHFGRLGAARPGGGRRLRAG